MAVTVVRTVVRRAAAGHHPPHHHLPCPATPTPAPDGAATSSYAHWTEVGTPRLCDLTTRIPADAQVLAAASGAVLRGTTPLAWTLLSPGLPTPCSFQRDDSGAVKHCNLPCHSSRPACLVVVRRRGLCETTALPAGATTPFALNTALHPPHTGPCATAWDKLATRTVQRRTVEHRTCVVCTGHAAAQHCDCDYAHLFVRT